MKTGHFGGLVRFEAKANLTQDMLLSLINNYVSLVTITDDRSGMLC